MVGTSDTELNGVVKLYVWAKLENEPFILEIGLNIYLVVGWMDSRKFLLPFIFFLNFKVEFTIRVRFDLIPEKALLRTRKRG